MPAVLITAGTKRIGFHLAQTCLGIGYSVILHFRSTDKVARLWLKRKPEYNGRVFFIQHDLTDSPETIIEKTGEFPCVLTGLVNNASTFTPGNLFDHRHLQQMLDIHLHVPARLGAHFAGCVTNGWIINIGDAMIRKPNITYQNYRMSKLFLEELTRQQAFLFAPGIRVNALAPGTILSAEGRSESEPDGFAALRKQVPLPATGSVDALIEAFLFLIKNSYCTGQIITIDGGWNLHC